MPALTGRALVAAMCLGQVGSLLPHVVVPAIMSQHLMHKEEVHFFVIAEPYIRMAL